MKRFILTLVSFSFAITVGEVLARVLAPPYATPFHYYFDPTLGPMPFPNERGSRTEPGVYTYTYSHNSLGLRSKEIGPKTRPRILILGDSFTYGFAVSDGETFSSLLEARLPQYEVINAGNPGQGTEYQLKFYRTIGRKLQPDIVILCFYANDFLDNQRGWYYNSELEEVPTVKPPLVGRSKIYKWAVEHSELARVIRAVLVKHIAPPPPLPLSRNEVLTQRFLSTLNAQVAGDGGRLLLFYIRAWGKVSEDETAFMEIAKDLHLPAVVFNISPSCYLLEGHWDAEGHKLAADIITRNLNGRSAN